MTKMDIETLILCSTGEGGIYTPKGLCNYYLVNHRTDTDDIEELQNGAGLEFILNSQKPDKYEIAEHFINKGLDVNGINHYGDKGLTPLHAAVLYNDIPRTHFLLNHGADTSIKMKQLNVTPLEFAHLLQEKKPQISRSEIIQLLKNSKKRQ